MQESNSMETDKRRDDRKLSHKTQLISHLSSMSSEEIQRFMIESAQKKIKNRNVQKN